jgi:hypothetical protein
VAAVLSATLAAWRPIQLAGLMLAVGAAFDLALYHRLLPYQPGWIALPLAVLELGAIMALAHAARIGAPVGAAIGFTVGSWLVTQALAHAVFPLVRVSYAEDGGELGRIGATAVAACVAVAAFAGGVAWGTRPPTVHLAAACTAAPL